MGSGLRPRAWSARLRRMILEPQSLSASAMYRFMIGIVVPRPIAFVSTVGNGGAFNVAPFSYFNAITNRPPLIGISITNRAGEPKDTLRNVQETGDFVVNAVNESLLERVVHASGEWGKDVDEFQLTGLTPVKSDLVRSPRVGESPLAMYCRSTSRGVAPFTSMEPRFRMSGERTSSRPSA